jgi:K+-transporting ATPase KdpF subunit
MFAFQVVGGLVSLALLGYLFFALLAPEKLQ